MNKFEFIDKLVRLYPSRFKVSDKNLHNEIVQEYYEILKVNFEVDYDLLWKTIREEYEYDKTPPCKWIKDRLVSCRLIEKDVCNLENTKTIWVKFPWLYPDMPYAVTVEKHQTETDVLKANMPSGWQWNYTLNRPEPIKEELKYE